MKKTVAVLTVVAVLSFGTLAFAFGGGYGFGGHMMGGSGMMGYGGYNGGHMMGWGSGTGNDEDTKEFLDETTEQRRDLNTKLFEFSEAYRTGDEKTAEKLVSEIEEISKKLYEKAPRGGNFDAGYGDHCS